MFPYHADAFDCIRGILADVVYMAVKFKVIVNNHSKVSYISSRLNVVECNVDSTDNPYLIGFICCQD